MSSVSSQYSLAIYDRQLYFCRISLSHMLTDFHAVLRVKLSLPVVHDLSSGEKIHWGVSPIIKLLFAMSSSRFSCCSIWKLTCRSCPTRRWGICWIGTAGKWKQRYSQVQDDIERCRHLHCEQSFHVPLPPLRCEASPTDEISSGSSDSQQVPQAASSERWVSKQLTVNT